MDGSLDIEIVIKSVVGLVVLLTLLIIVFVLPARAKKKKVQKQVKKRIQTTVEKEVALDFDDLRAIVRRHSSSKEDLQKAIDQIVKHYSKIPPKLGIRNHPDFDKYVDLIVHLVRHTNTNKDLILQLDRALTKNNSEYKAELNDTLSKALNSRGI